MIKIITGVLLAITCTYALAEEKSTYKILLNKNTKEIKILKRINESQNKNEEFYGVDRLKIALKECTECTAEDTLINVFNDLKVILDGLSILDDLTLMCIEKKKL